MYYNNPEFQKNRLIVLKESDNKCVKCGSEAELVHHIDKGKDDHTIKNLEPLCTKCHAIRHRKYKYKRNNDNVYKQKSYRFYHKRKHDDFMIKVKFDDGLSFQEFVDEAIEDYLNGDYQP